MKKLLILINIILFNSMLFARSDAKTTNGITEVERYVYKEADIFNTEKQDLIFNISTLQNIKPSYNITSLRFVAQHEVKKNLRLGALLEYRYHEKANVAKIGFVTGYKNLDAYVAYRLVEYKKSLNHNLDVFAKFTHKFNIKKVNIDSSISALVTYSSKTPLTENGDSSKELYDQFTLGVNLATSISYEVIDNLSLVARPSIDLLYQDQEKVEKNKTTSGDKIKYSYFNYNLDLGIKYKRSNFSVVPLLKLTGDAKGHIKLGFDVTTGYKF